jgi:hypothetical protein
MFSRPLKNMFLVLTIVVLIQFTSSRFLSLRIPTNLTNELLTDIAKEPSQVFKVKLF